MSKTSFNNIVRSAIWHSYNSICFYCTRPLDWDDLHIDHIIPESLEDKPEELKILLESHDIDKNFSVNELYNLVPTHSKCNTRKNDILFPKQTALFYLSLAKEKVNKIESEIKKLENRRNKGQIISKLQAALSSQIISVVELKELIYEAEANNWNTTKITLPHGVEFIDEIYNEFYANGDYTNLLDKEIDCELSVINDIGETLSIYTLRQWQSAVKLGFYPKTNIDIKFASSHFTFLEELIEALRQAKMPKISYISEPWIDITNLDYLSPSILGDFEGELQKHAEKNKSIGDLVREGIIKVNQGGFYAISLEYGYFETSFIEQFRADFNSDGIEDIFVRGWVQAIGGTMGYGFTSYLTRKSHTSLIESM